MSEHSTHLFEIVLLLAAAVCIVSLFRHLRLSPVLGYIFSGALIGPHGFALIKDTETTQLFAEFGVVFLLFVIGLELSLDKLKRMRRYVFGFGSAQVLLTGGIIGVVAHTLGASTGASIVIGGGLALSSTAIVLQLIGEGGAKATQTGRLSLAVLILQDLAIVPLLVLVPLLASQQGSLLFALTEAGVKAMVGLALIVLLGQVMLQPLFRYIAAHDHQELFTATTLLIVLGLAYVSSLAGVSPALGAFMAGLLVAETEYKPEVEADILPFKQLLLGLFFIMVGMTVDLGYAAEHVAAIAGTTFALIAGKAVLMYALCRIFSFSHGTALHSSLLLAPGGEFAFALFSLAAGAAVLDASTAQLLLSAVAISMALTPLLHSTGTALAAMRERRSESAGEPQQREPLDLHDHVIICGYGRVGRLIARLLDEEGIPHIGLDMHSDNVSKLREAGHRVYFGDASRRIVMRAVGAGRASAIIITHTDIQMGMASVRTVRELNPHVPIIARAFNIDDVLKLEAAGAKLAVAEMFETSLQLGGAALKELGVPEPEVSRVLDAFRAEDYALTRHSEGEKPASPAGDFAI